MLNLNSPEPQQSKNNNRRSFLKVAGLTGAATIFGAKFGDLLGGVIEDSAESEPRLAKYLTAIRESLGKFSPDKYPKINSYLDLQSRLVADIDTPELPSLNSFRLMVDDPSLAVDRQMGLALRQPVSEVAIASVVKIPVCLKAVQESQITGQNYLTSELSERILRYSSNDHLDELVKSLPSSQGKSDYQTYKQIVELMGIRVTGQHAPLRVDFSSMMNFLVSNQHFPSIMEGSLTPKLEDSPLSYYASGIALKDSEVLSGGSSQTLFKIGLIETPLREGETVSQPTVTWFLRQNAVTNLGFACGGWLDSITAMLYSVSATSKYALRNFYPPS